MRGKIRFRASRDSFRKIRWLGWSDWDEGEELSWSRHGSRSNGKTCQFDLCETKIQIDMIEKNRFGVVH